MTEIPRRDAIIAGAGAGLAGLAAARPDQQYYPAQGGQQIPGSRTGPLRAREVIVFGSGKNTGIFVYSPAPAFGNLIASIAAVGGTDPYGNAYAPGVTSYFQLGGVYVALSLVSGQITWATATGPGGPLSLNGPSISVDPTTGTILNIAPGSGGHANVITGLFNMQGGAQVLSGLSVSGGESVSGGLTADVETISGSSTLPLLSVINAVSSAGGAVSITVQASGNPAWLCFINGDTRARLRGDVGTNGGRIVAGGGTASPDTSLGRASANLWASDFIAFDSGTQTAEAWQSPTFANGWTNSGIPLGYKRVAAPDHCLAWIGDLTAPAGLATGQAVITALAAAYRPASNQTVLGVDLTTGGLVRFVYLTTGVLQYQQGSVAGHSISLQAQLNELDR